MGEIEPNHKQNISVTGGFLVLVFCLCLPNFFNRNEWYNVSLKKKKKKLYSFVIQTRLQLTFKLDFK